MKSRLPKFLASCLLLLAAMNPRPHVQTPAPSSRSFPSWTTGLKKAVEVQKWRDGVTWGEIAAWVAASKPQHRDTLPTEESQHVAHFDPGSVQQLIVDVFGSAAPAALAVARCESHYDASAVNGRYRGVFQVGDMHAAAWLEITGRDYWDSWMDPVANVTYAHALFLAAGWGPWSCKP